MKAVDISGEDERSSESGAACVEWHMEEENEIRQRRSMFSVMSCSGNRAKEGIHRE